MILPIATVLFFGGREFMLKTDANTMTPDDWAPLLALLAPVIVMIIFRIVSLETTIRSEGIYYRFKPFRRKPRFHQWADIERFYVRKYNPIREYGGWGVKKGRKKASTAFNVRGNMGLQLELKNGKRILIGTQKAEELERVVKKLET